MKPIRSLKRWHLLGAAICCVTALSVPQRAVAQDCPHRDYVSFMQDMLDRYKSLQDLSRPRSGSGTGNRILSALANEAKKAVEDQTRTIIARCDDYATTFVSQGIKAAVPEGSDTSGRVLNVLGNLAVERWLKSDPSRAEAIRVVQRWVAGLR